MVRRALWQAWERDRRGEADLLLCAHVASVAYLGTTDLDRPNPGLDRAMRPMVQTLSVRFTATERCERGAARRVLIDSDLWSEPSLDDP